MPEGEKTYQIIATGKLSLAHVDNAGIDHRIADNEEEIERAWRKALEESGGKYFNDPMLSFAGYEKKPGGVDVFGHYVGFKNFIVHIEKPELGLEVIPVGVSGFVVVEDDGERFVVVARKSEITGPYEGYYETIPAGSIDDRCLKDDGTINFREKLLEEFEEESMMPRERVSAVSDLAFILDTEMMVYDVCCALLVRMPREEVLSYMAGSSEYDDPVLVRETELEDFLYSKGEKVVPTSLGMAEVYRRLRETLFEESDFL